MKTATLRSWFIAILFILFSGNTFSQSSEGDKLLLQISKETNDTSKVNLMIRYVRLYGSALDYHEHFNEIHVLSLKNDYRPGLAYYRFYEGMLLWTFINLLTPWVPQVY